MTKCKTKLEQNFLNREENVSAAAFPPSQATHLLIINSAVAAMVNKKSSINCEKNFVLPHETVH